MLMTTETAKTSRHALELVDATPETIKPVGELLGPENFEAGLGIPFYTGAVIEGKPIHFRHTGRAVVRCAKVFRRAPEVTWLERHMHLTQMFIGLGSKPFLMVLAPPNHVDGKDVPDVELARTYRIPAGQALLLHLGTWHDFPIAAEDDATVITMNSEEVVDALVTMGAPGEMDHGDVRKLDVAARTGTQLVISYPD
jgi:ureidoglycolate lyase